MKISNKKAVTLVELLLAVAILVFAISGILLLFIHCSFLNESSRNLTIAASHAQFVMEDMKSASFSTLQQNINAGNWNWQPDIIESKGLTALSNESISTQAAGANPLDISVTVSWQDRNQRDRDFVLETIMGNS
jgi:type II secretory pathway pseudopilin PulG